ncbi:SDR family NAD(P)-dependent oxidoreductase [Neorhodopirellula pilleata]|uniref:Putative oxidoreductase n=1 Tax=Neorhodopirellula pilleata TaxID=2714738 RepID=A0A5C6A354_9BACT|nr:SDR family NAD(P)-dependent oxidoreductase [Neorhodopirellula pilleata]TWT93621.1 putative oxidoreductase [Neorhodopirellula pilleata]
MNAEQAHRTAIVSGGSSGVGLAITRRLLDENYHVTVLGRDAARLDKMKSLMTDRSIDADQIHTCVCDATLRQPVDDAVAAHMAMFGRLDVLVNVVGRSDRGTIEGLDADHLKSLFDANVISALTCVQACLPSLKTSRGTIVNIGSLAGHVAPRFLGGYAIAKHALVGMTNQLRLECEPDGVHVGLVSPGPIHDPDRQTDNRYGVDESSGVPMQAARPGGGAKVKTLTAEQVATAVMRCITDREPEVILPGKTRYLMAIAALWPTLGKRILRSKTS